MATTQAWLPANSLPRGLHGDDPYLLVDIVSDSGSRTTVRLPDGSTATVDTSGLSPPVSEEATDMAMLLHMSEATVLDNLLKRYKAAEPYTYTGEILMSVNPCERLEKLHSAETMCSYAGRLLGGNRPPHLYAIAEEAYRLLLKTRSHQGMVVSGVSGAGKTEANKIIMQYLCWRASHSAGLIGRNLTLSQDAVNAAEQLANGGYTGLDELPKRILHSNVIFEAFGNASTTNNDNSSRFGKFVRLLFDGKGRVKGARVSTYLLEKSRLTLQCPMERNFHVLWCRLPS